MSISSEQVQRLVDKATQRSGKIYRLPNCLTWRDSITVENGEVFLWYNTPTEWITDDAGKDIGIAMTTCVVTEPEEA